MKREHGFPAAGYGVHRRPGFEEDGNDTTHVSSPSQTIPTDTVRSYFSQADPNRLKTFGVPFSVSSIPAQMPECSFCLPLTSRRTPGNNPPPGGRKTRGGRPRPAGFSSVFHTLLHSLPH